MSETGVFDKFKEATVSPVLELCRLIPDSILFGSIVLYFLTQNIAFGIFGIFIVETVFSHRLISWLYTQSVGPSRSMTADTIKCHAGFRTPQWKVDRMFSHDNYPSYSIFSITSIGTYLYLATSEFSSTLKAMGSQWESRQMVASSLLALVLVCFVLVRWSAGCESWAEMGIAMLFAIIVGIVFFFINKNLFGVEGMNFLGLPYLVSKESKESPIYICAADTSQQKN